MGQPVFDHLHTFHLDVGAMPEDLCDVVAGHLRQQGVMGGCTGELCEASPVMEQYGTSLP